MPIYPSQSFHLVHLRPWPFTSAIGGGILAIAFVIFFHIPTWHGIITAFTFILIPTILAWWRDVIREAVYFGIHNIKVQHGLELGIILFIVSEVIFFFAFFWTFLHRRLAPTRDIGCSWPPAGVIPLNPYGVPLLNTAVLLASGVTITWAHHGLINNFKCELVWGLGVTITLGLYFSFLQYNEYAITPFGINDSTYGAIFFVATGFHGLHVIIGSRFLLVCWARAHLYQFSNSHHLGLEFAAWYWHFVDVVWIILYMIVYWWGS